MTYETWRLLIDEPLDGAANMARDEAILAAHAAGTTLPTLRLYRWRPACLSLGRFQRSDAIDRTACERAGVAVVRRPSGGRALLHDEELTYAVVCRAGHPRFGGDLILETYRQISLALGAGLRRLGVDVMLTPVGRRHLAGSAACFDTPAAYELMVAGRKLAGSAQVRRAGALLQHGAIPLAPHAARLAALLADPPADLGAKMIALDEALGRAVEFDAVVDALVGGFAAVWGITIERGELTSGEYEQEQRLRAEKYGDDGWTYAR